MTRRLGISLACVAATTATALAASPSVGTRTISEATTISVSPDPPVPDRPFVVTAHTGSLVGVPTYSWSLDGDRACETPPATSPDITLTLPRGAHPLFSCVTDSSGTLTTEHTVLVDPRPRLEAGRLKSRELDFVLSGLELPIHWDPPTRAKYTVTYSPSSDTPNPAQVPLKVREENRGTLTVLHISPPPAGTRVPIYYRRFEGFLYLRWDLMNDPRLGAGGGTGSRRIGFFKPEFFRPGPFGAPINPRMTLAASLRGHTVIVAVGAGAARGRTVTLRLINETRPPLQITRRIRLVGARTGVRWPIPNAVWGAGFAAINLRAQFRRKGIVYSNIVPGGGQWRYLHWQP